MILNLYLNKSLVYVLWGLLNYLVIYAVARCTTLCLKCTGIGYRLMKKKVYEKKFPSHEEACRYLEDRKWEFLGKKGLFNKYYLYRAVAVYAEAIQRGGSNLEVYDLHLNQDGLVQIYVPVSSSLGGMSSLPEKVWSSYDAYLVLTNLVWLVGQELHNSRVQIVHEGKYILETNDFASIEFDHPKYLYEYALNNGMTISDLGYEGIQERLKEQGII